MSADALNCSETRMNAGLIMKSDFDGELLDSLDEPTGVSVDDVLDLSAFGVTSATDIAVG